MTDILPMNKTVQLVADNSSLTIRGYAFATVESGICVQRWVFKVDEETNLMWALPPCGDPLVLREPPASDEWRTINVMDFITMARNRWMSGWRYVKVNCTMYTAGSEVPTSPAPAGFPGPPRGGQYQGDTGTMELRSGDGSLLGYVYTEAESTVDRWEYWALRNSYTPPEGNARVKLQRMSSVRDFNNLITGKWLEGDPQFPYGICACRYYEGVPEPA